MAKVRAAVIGGGIIGLAVARELLHRMDAVEVTLFEKETRVAAHQTGHNSGVVHAGLYYPPGSLKARLCRRGVTLLQQYAQDKGVAYEECGKVVVAHDASEVGRMDAIFDRAVANGVPGIRKIAGAEIPEIEPHARGVAAVHSPHTAIIDYVAIAEALAADIAAAGGRVLLGREVVGLDSRASETVVTTGHGSEVFDLVVTCAGLQSDRVALLSGEPRTPRVVPFFGDYFLLEPERSSLVKGLIYPVPDPRYPFLGVHLTKRIDGRIMLGPNAFLSLGREAYDRRGWSASDVVSAVGFPGFWRFAAHNTAAAVREARTVLSTGQFVKEAQKYVPDLRRSDVTRGPRGIRAQAMNADGSLEDDFVITGGHRVIHVRNAPSPGATSSLAIAEHVVTEVLERTTT
ncbi:hydroxyglutarate oxidase [Rhodococcus sp. ACS1]|uniref:L-2-hydroxyglutarate oxidase LhgO n=1 Tax=Rhodococcus koreensis TaxID=99653 RepID=A0A1H4T4A2_9NOCA|nr:MULTISPECIES: L-2-hydroxyglutarate oxidase [Rhodococcus]PBC46313.1 hydroxyglutarate oxidase [Rhodococcus sp. ACS1]QSE82278.1 L-2-hydroxyglutarate oxidase [Rhodococcus koreensis]SEC51305.1 L-2-hydroxyglutarate oxidase LhgO [Rhodococcus koreensis]